MLELVRICRNPACGQERRVAVATPACPECKTAYGPIVLGLDRDPREPTVVETTEQYNARHEREQRQWLAEQTRQAAVTPSRDDSATQQQEEPISDHRSTTTDT